MTALYYWLGCLGILGLAYVYVVIVAHLMFWAVKGTVALGRVATREWMAYAWRPPSDSPALRREVAPCGPPVGKEVSP